MQSWIKVDKNSDFSIYNLPFGIFSESDQIKRVGIAIGDHVIDLYAAYELGVFKEHIIFHEVNFDRIDKIRGLDVVVVIAAINKDHSFALLEKLNFPFIKKGDN